MAEQTTIDELLDLEGENQPEKVDGHQTGPGAAVSRRQAAERKVFLGRALAANHSSEEIYEAMAQQYGMDRQAVDRLELKVFETWETEKTKRSKYFSEAARLRLYELMRKMIKEKAWPSVMQCENLIAKIEGTMAPVEVHTSGTVAHGGAIAHLFGQMDRDELLGIVEAERQRAQVEGEAIEVTPALPEDTSE